VLSGRRKNGEEFPLEIAVSDATHDNDVLFVGMMRDLSPIEEERRRVNALRDELARVSRLNDMAGMVAGLAHEVGQPVAAILNFAATYRRAMAAPGKAPEAGLIAKIEEQARRAAEILRRLRGFIEKRPPERRSVPIRDLIDDALKLTTFRSKPRLVRTPAPPEIRKARVWADPIQIEQVLVNLLRNADDALLDTDTPELIIETSLAGSGRLRLSVADNGAGVDREAVGELFDLFFTTKPFGMGVGLSISKEIVEGHAGVINYRPNAPSGSIFEIELPIHSENRKR
jgi:two-component system, LuxR family, sensor kinase FixL